MKISLTIEESIGTKRVNFRNLCMTKSNKNETTYNEVKDQPKHQPSHEFILRLKIKRNDWLFADTRPQAANHCALFLA